MKKILTLLIVLACPFLGQAKTFIVCVGVSDYPGTANDLNLSAHDAECVRDLFVRNSDTEAILLMNEEATGEHIFEAMKNLYSRATEDDAIIFFFSGHGVPGAFMCYNGRFFYHNITREMAASRARNKMVFADACYSGKVRNTSRRHRKTEEQHRNSGNVMFFLSSRTGEYSIERRGEWENSLFTAFMLRGLRGGADTNKDRSISARELFDFVSKGVAGASQDRQHPVMWGNFSSTMTIMKW